TAVGVSHRREEMAASECPAIRLLTSADTKGFRTQKPDTENLLKQIRYQRFFLFQLVHARLNFLSAEFVEGKALDDFPLAAVAADRKRSDDVFFDPIAAIRTNGDAEPIAFGRGARQGPNGVDDGIGRGSSG